MRHEEIVASTVIPLSSCINYRERAKKLTHIIHDRDQL
jgi:hypothetical protein